MTNEPVHLRLVLEQLLKDFGTPDIKSITSIVDQWEDIVGPDLASKISAIAIKGSELIVRVDDPAWASQISWLENQLLEFEVMPSAISSSFFNRSNCFSSKLRWPESTISIYTLEGFNGFYEKSGL